MVYSPEVHRLHAHRTIPHALGPALWLLFSGGRGGALKPAAGGSPRETGGCRLGGGPLKDRARGAEHGGRGRHRGLRRSVLSYWHPSRYGMVRERFWEWIMDDFELSSSLDWKVKVNHGKLGWL